MTDFEPVNIGAIDGAQDTESRVPEGSDPTFAGARLPFDETATAGPKSEPAYNGPLSVSADRASSIRPENGQAPDEMAGRQVNVPESSAGSDHLRHDHAAEGQQTHAIDITTAALDYIAPDLRPLAVPIETLTEAPDNARTHGDLAPLADSYRRSGQQKPIVVKRSYRGTSNVVIAGNGTLQAARRLGWTHLAVSWFEGDDDEARVYAISDNRTAELSSWDGGQLAALQADGCDLLSLWHDDVGLADLLGADAPVPHFEPEPEADQRPLDVLAENIICPACGHRFHQEAR